MNCNKCGKEIANIQTASCTNFVCKKCGSTEYEIKDKSNGNGIAHGLYCAKCGFWHKWLNKKELVYYKNIKLKDFKSNIDNLFIAFDEMGFAPTTVCPDPEEYAIEWREKVRAEFERLENENTALRERLDNAVELPCKVGDKVYGVGFTDCEDSRTTDEKKKRQIFNVCMKMGGNCEKCKYRRPQIEEFVCTHIQLGDCGIEGKSILIVGDRNENYTANNVFTTSEAAEARLAELNSLFKEDIAEEK